MKRTDLLDWLALVGLGSAGAELSLVTRLATGVTNEVSIHPNDPRWT